ncbi:PREDICTED: replication protein A 70 kDa DNA-binding subunit D-like [Ipomoea nil]|uniref:replication protein A 70 kDa DNA-binding subunit D-like n=1 Tax=Ipomoea nil TaxID=35883 RepID=UPI000901AC17|nr:PREDICTED: replication protein A 70 kDa DNA-binding subunit D-like [Ipomoea nil]
MAGQFVLASQPKPEFTTKAIRARLVRTYEVPENNKANGTRSIECLFHDEEGTFIHVHISKKQVEKYTSKFKEGKVYGIKNWLCVKNFLKYKTSQHPYVLKFKHDTLVKEYKRIDFPNHVFRIKSFPSLILKQDVDEKELIDVIGRVVEIYSPIERNVGGRMAKLIDFVLEDGNENQLHCTVWDDHVDQLVPYFNSTSLEPIILLLQLCRARLLDNGEVRISSSFDATKLWFNQRSHEFVSFVESLPSVCTPLRRIQSESRLSLVKMERSCSSSEVVVTTIEEVYTRKKLSEYWIAATILGVESLDDWYYISCKGSSCSRKLVPLNGLMYYSKCDRSWKEGSIKYKVVVRVRDSSTDAPFLLWDREC